MSEYNPSTIHFTINESVWFEREQAVEELRSISLNPHINLFDEQEFVVLKGALELEGEYKQQSSEDEITANEQIYVQSIRLVDEDEWQFTHRFPVDITIPKRKINHVEDVIMTVRSFDYEIENDQRLIITADIEIDGIIEAEESSIIRNEKVEEEIPLTVVKRNEANIQEVEVDDTFSVEAELEEVPEAEFEQQSIPILREEDYVVKAPEPIEIEAEAIEEVEEVEEVEEKQETPKVEVKSQPEPTPRENPAPVELEEEKQSQLELELIRNEQEKAEQEPEVAQLVIEQETKEEMERESPSSAYIEVDAHPEPESLPIEEIDIESSSHETIPVVKKNKGSTVTMSFAEFFSRKEEELARIKIYVVQEDDSLASIADRYDVSVQQILRANHLDITAEVNSGQLLTIPVLSETKK